MYGTAADAVLLVSIRRDLESFGEIARAGMTKINHWQEVVQAVYYDIRSAIAAKEYFGDFCDFGPQEQDLVVLVPKTMSDALQFLEVASKVSREDGDHEVEFFDTRVATQMAKLMIACASPTHDNSAAISTCDSLGALEDDQHSDDATSVHDALEPMSVVCAASATPSDDGIQPMPVACTASDSRCKGSSSEPRRISSLRMSQIRWEDFESQREWRTSLLLRGLPSSLCQPGRLEVFLEARGLGGVVSSVRVPKAVSKSVGHAIITAASVKDVPVLAKFFHGRQLGRMPVAVSFAPVQGGMASRKGAASVVSSSVAAVASKVDLPKHKPTISLVDCSVFDNDKDDASSTCLASPRSTESPCSDDLASPQSDLFSLEPPPGLPAIAPPPGLECQ
jgi:hypothetical protein